MLRPIFWTLLLLTCCYAFWRGRSDEKIAAMTCLLASIATHFVIPPATVSFSHLEQGLLAIDGAVLTSFFAVALRSQRFWPLWVAGLQLTNSMAHLMKAVDFGLMRQAYFAAVAFWSYPILLIILIGTWRTHRRELRNKQAPA